jgi:hypothetical protein
MDKLATGLAERRDQTFSILRDLSDFTNQLEDLGLVEQANAANKIFNDMFEMIQRYDPILPRVVTAQEEDDIPTADQETRIRSPITEDLGEETWVEEDPARLVGDESRGAPIEEHLMEHPLVAELDPFIRKVYARCMRDLKMVQHTKEIQDVTRQRGWDAGLEIQRQLVPEIPGKDIQLPLAEETTITPTVGGEGVTLSVKELREIAMRAANLNSRFEEVGMASIKNDEEESPLHPSQFFNLMKAALYKVLLRERGLVSGQLSECIAEWALDPVAIYADYYKEEFDDRFQPAEVETYYIPKLVRWLTGG